MVIHAPRFNATNPNPFSKNLLLFEEIKYLEGGKPSRLDSSFELTGSDMEF
jgi:hypothetical protein